MFDTTHIEPILLTVFACTGFWGLISIIVQYFLNKRDKETEEQKKMNKMVLGLGHDRICFLGMAYVERGYITKDEYEDLVTYLYKPYKALDGNGTAELVINKVKELPMTVSKDSSDILSTQTSGHHNVSASSNMPVQNVYSDIHTHPLDLS